MKFKAFCMIPHAGEIEIKPLTLCKDCKHFSEVNGEGECKLYGWRADGDWFCADGEKAEDDG